jgi:hypothetical protein
VSDKSVVRLNKEREQQPKDYYLVLGKKRNQVRKSIIENFDRNVLGRNNGGHLHAYGKEIVPAMKKLLLRENFSFYWQKDACCSFQLEINCKLKIKFSGVTGHY